LATYYADSALKKNLFLRERSIYVIKRLNMVKADIAKLRASKATLEGRLGG
jgi:hypothetical protein